MRREKGQRTLVILLVCGNRAGLQPDCWPVGGGGNWARGERVTMRPVQPVPPLPADVQRRREARPASKISLHRFVCGGGSCGLWVCRECRAWWRRCMGL